MLEVVNDLLQPSYGHLKGLSPKQMINMTYESPLIVVDNIQADSLLATYIVCTHECGEGWQPAHVCAQV